MAKYSVGDWTKNIYGDLQSFGRITKVRDIDHCCAYDLTFALPSKDTFAKPRYFADVSHVAECKIIPVTDPSDILLCRAMELQEQYQDILKKTEKLKMDLEALSRVRGLL